MEHLISQLKLKINEKLGFIIKRQSDVKYLHQQITAKILAPPGFNTLRRFYGFLPYGEPQFKTLDRLSEFLGYQSFTEFSEITNKDENWNIWTFINDFENANTISSLMLERLVLLKPHHDYSYFISVIIKSFIRRDRLDLLKVIFAKRPESLLLSKEDLNSKDALEVFKIAYAVGGVLRTLSKPKYEKLLPLLSDDYVFNSNILDCYIDYSNFNNYYGFFTKHRLLLQSKPQDQIFLNLLSNYHLFLSGKNSYKIYKPAIFGFQLYPALYGRLLGYELLTTYFKKQQSIQTVVNRIVKIAATQHISVFFIEIFPALILIKAIEDVAYLFSKFSDDLFMIDNWRYYATQNMYLVSIALVEIKNKDFEAAEHHLGLVSLEHTVANSYYSYLKLFYLIASYQLEKQTTAHRRLLTDIVKEYRFLVKQTGFKRFNLTLLKKYF